MTVVYTILAVAGWIWAGVVGTLALIWWWRGRRPGRRGFEVVVEKHEKQP